MILRVFSRWGFPTFRSVRPVSISCDLSNFAPLAFEFNEATQISNLSANEASQSKESYDGQSPIPSQAGNCSSNEKDKVSTQIIADGSDVSEKQDILKSYSEPEYPITKRRREVLQNRQPLPSVPSTPLSQKLIRVRAPSPSKLESLNSTKQNHKESLPPSTGELVVGKDILASVPTSIQGRWSALSPEKRDFLRQKIETERTQKKQAPHQISEDVARDAATRKVRIIANGNNSADTVDATSLPGDPVVRRTKPWEGSAVRETVEPSSALKDGVFLRPDEIDMKTIPPLELRRVPTLAHDLDRVLFNPGVHYLRDPRSRVWNFDPYLEHIMPVEEFDFDVLHEYVTSSADEMLIQMARNTSANFVGSTSSMSSALSHFHFLLSSFRPVNVEMLSTRFTGQSNAFTTIQRAMSSIYLRYCGDGVYAIDADKQYEGGETVLTWLGKSMEKFLTISPEKMEEYRKVNSHKIPEEEKNQREAYHYSRSGSLLMRSQLDCSDPRLPGTGVFDLKTRACLAVRMNIENVDEAAGYEIKSNTGMYESFEREYYDMVRAAFLKYSLQVRIGDMDGIFVAYHNTERIFGFQYISLEEMDRTLHGSGDRNIGQREFLMSIKLFNETLERAVTKFPEQSMRVSFEARPTKNTKMYIFVEPMSDEEIDLIQSGQAAEAVEAVVDLTKRLKHPPLEDINARASKVEIALSEKEELESTSQLDQMTEDSHDRPTETDGAISYLFTSEENPSNKFIADVDLSPESGPLWIPDTTDVEPKKKRKSKFGASSSELPLLHYELHIRNYINGDLQEASPQPSAQDDWTISYKFEEKASIDTWKRYEAVIERLKSAKPLPPIARTDGDEEGEAEVDNYLAGFRASLLDLARKGRSWRKARNEEDAKEPTVIWKEGQSPIRNSDP